MTDLPEEKGFLGRWSRRKLAGAAEEETPTAPAALPAAAPACPIPDLPEIDLASLPRIEDLTASTDLAPFLRPGVPAALRAAALRRMWSVDPAIRDFINCVDYQWDFNTPGGLPFGFSAELGGDVVKLLRQAIGLDEDGKPHAPLPAPEAAPDAPAEAVPEAEPEPVLVAEDTPPEPGPARRRHGGALPA